MFSRGGSLKDVAKSLESCRVVWIDETGLVLLFNPKRCGRRAEDLAQIDERN